MNEILLNVLSVATTAIVLPLISFLGVKLTQWLNSKIKDERAKTLLEKANGIVLDAVRSVFQTYVESLKASGSFDSQAQSIALGKAKVIIESELTEDLKRFIGENYGDVSSWIGNAIEASIYKLKN